MSPKRASSALMPASLPLVISPLRSVLECDGVEVVLVSVEVWRDEVVVRARGLPGEGPLGQPSDGLTDDRGISVRRCGVR
jgi:hypothetical protein